MTEEELFQIMSGLAYQTLWITNAIKTHSQWNGTPPIGENQAVSWQAWATDFAQEIAGNQIAANKKWLAGQSDY